MVTVEFSNKKMELTIKGHAGADEKGKDIVCASVSALFYTLVQNLELNEKMLKKGSLRVKEEEGDCLVSCRPLKVYEANVCLIYMVVLNGLEMVSKNFPQFVEFSVKG